jgi:hypothetical protein
VEGIKGPQYRFKGFASKVMLTSRIILGFSVENKSIFINGILLGVGYSSSAMA